MQLSIRGSGFKDGRLRLWTIQGWEAWKSFQRRGVLRADGRRIMPDFRFGYQWMIGQMQKRLPAYSGRYPIWAWLSPKPDLRSAALLNPGEKGVRIEFLVPQERVLLSGCEAWTVVLNWGYLSFTEEEDLRWECESNGLQYHQLPTRRQHLIRKSWERIFDLEALNASDWVGPVRSIQATLEELHLNEMVGAREFAAR